ncbi:hypothetical protein GIB67_023428 [Kingdonia uniflora]|uniref:TF-B3 domain-containing protein n=1 Tax=Kingdonia uniflora TaxID=39325 RepID=A0A7J7P9N2_9MAGN|nr:hypothetical protein GIB67_023428 [Kingdonia uniflora]
MQKSFVGNTLWMNLIPFCKSYLPKQDDTFTLIDEDKEESTVKFGSESMGFGYGWKYFSTSHQLVEGDALVFQLTKATEFQVFIIRAYSPPGVDKGFGLRVSEALTKQNVPYKPTGISEKVNHDKAKTCTKERAEEVQGNLDPKYPSFVNSMQPSFVDRGKSWMILIFGSLVTIIDPGGSRSFSIVLWIKNFPAQFCKSCLPKHDVTITLIDEDKVKSTVKFGSVSMAFGTGWKDFTTAHKLVEGDALVFQLIKATEFQVFIVRAYSLSGVDKGFGVQHSEAPAKQIATCKPIRNHEKTKLKCPSTLPLGTIPVIISDSEREESENNSRSSEVSGGVIFWGSLDREGFDVAVDALRKNSELSKDTWTKYYELCRSQNTFLHENLLKQNIKLVDGIISETVIIADGVKGSRLSTFMNDFASWDQSLEGFEHLGMNVGFLRTKLQRLVNLISELDPERYSKEHKEALAESVCMEENLKRLDAVLQSLEKRVKTDEQKFQEEVNAPW